MSSNTYKLRITSVELEEYFNIDDGFVSIEDGNNYILECYNSWEENETDFYTINWKINREKSDYYPSLDNKPKFNKLCDKWNKRKGIRWNSPYDIELTHNNLVEDEDEDEIKKETVVIAPTKTKRKLRNPTH